MTDSDSHADDVCRICGFGTKPWEELVDGMCPDCRFENRVDVSDHDR